MIKDNRLYLTEQELDTTKQVLTELMEISEDDLSKTIIKSVVDIIIGIKGLKPTTQQSLDREDK